MNIKIKLSEGAIMPSYSKEGDAGLDLTAISKIFSYNYNYIEYGTGVHVEIPEGYVGLVFPRSSISKYGISLSNSVGVIDSNYRGEIKFRFRRLAFSKNVYNIGDRIGQLIIIPYPKINFILTENLSETSRGAGGFGSTGK
jgi:dUTP pyrophosphatase